MYIPSPQLINAIALASRLHRNQYRKDKDATPYISHLYSVAMYIASVTDDEEVIIAGLMHDSIEDVPDYTYEDLVADCGMNVAQLVAQVTEDHKLPYKEKKLLYLDQIRNGDHRVLAISLADKIHNASTYNLLPEDQKHKGHRYMYDEICNIAREKIDNANIEGDNEYAYVRPLLIKLEEYLQEIVSVD